MRFRRAALDWHQLQNENECFFLRIYGPGDYRWKGSDLGVLVTKGRLQTEEAPSAAEPADWVDVTAPPAADLAVEGGEELAPDLIADAESDAAAVNDPGENADPVTAVLAGKSRLTARGKKLIDAIRMQYAGVPVGAEFTAPATTVGVKSGG